MNIDPLQYLHMEYNKLLEKIKTIREEILNIKILNFGLEKKLEDEIKENKKIKLDYVFLT